MSEKVKVSREVAHAIVWSIQWHRKNRPDLETTRDIHEEMISLSVQEAFQGEEEILNTIPTFDLAEMLIKGYEIEETPEEKVLRLHQNIEDDYNTDFQNEERYVTGYRDGIEATLDAYNIKIKGINDKESTE